jgi:hypothetical protein
MAEMLYCGSYYILYDYHTLSQHYHRIITGHQMDESTTPDQTGGLIIPS